MYPQHVTPYETAEPGCPHPRENQTLVLSELVKQK